MPPSKDQTIKPSNSKGKSPAKRRAGFTARPADGPAAPQAVAAFDEEGRIRALNRLEILDTAHEAPFETIVELVCQVLQVPICAVSLIDSERQWFKAYRGLKVAETARDISFCTHAIKQDAPFTVEDAANTPLFAANPLVASNPGIRSYAGAQLRTKDGFAIGTLCAIDTVPRVFSPPEIAILAKFADLVMDDIEMREIASTDALTGVMSRRAWLNCAEDEVRRAFRSGTRLAFFMMDIDHFKQVNDRFGHPVGDLVIKEVARIAEAQLRQSDWFGRYGGEEFVAALPGSLPENAMIVAEHIRAAVEAMRLPCLGDHRCTISIGVAELEAREISPAAALGRADQALLRAKQSGRNQVQAAKPQRNSGRVAA